MQEQSPAAPATSDDPVDTPRRMSRKAVLLGSVVAFALVAGLAWLAWELTHPDTPATPAGGPPGAGAGRGPGGGGPGGGGGRGGRGGGPATTVGIAVAETADLPVTLDALGTVVPRASVRVRPQVSGVLQKIEFREGQTVKAGQLLAQVDPRPFEMALQQAVAARMRNEAQLEAARVTLARYRTLLQQDSIARQEVDTQAAQVRQFEATLVADKATEGTARLNLGYTRITAPIGGRIGLRTVDVGNVVGPGDANGVALITQVVPIDVEFAIPQDHAAWLQTNGGGFMEVKAFDRTRTELLDTGVFASLDNQVDTQTGTVRAKARFNNARMQLFPSQFVNVNLQLRTIRDAVVVPVNALRKGGQGDYVFVLQADRTVQLRPVVRGQLLGERVQVASGLQAGERVVTEGADRLRDGSRVSLPGDTPGQGAGGGGGRGPRGEGARPAAPAASAAVEPFTNASAARAPGPSAPASATMGAAPGGRGPVGADAAAQRGPATSASMPGGAPRAGNSPGAASVAASGAVPGPGPGAGPGGGRGNLTPEEREERRRRMEAMSPEEREAMRERFRQRREAGGAGAGPATQ